MNKHLKFILKAFPLSVAMAVAALYVTSRYEIGIDPQKNTCLNWRVFVVDRYDTKVDRDKIYAFRSTQMEPFFPNGTKIIKYVRGIPGDRVTVGKEVISVNGTSRGEGLLLAARLGKPENRYIRDEIIPENMFWFMGTSHDSFDSRYWGYVSSSDVVGRAYPIW
ncbi:signal peptidase I [Pseudomonas carnis]|uniref:signal peptidase I n=1 Tax=Pseudomonas carnis TaxID=2487355 RepID=UPI001C6F66A9|nr:signal peptidase I [Pseudomonas carnis]MBW9241020.1 signal peptidase I [Pseudomonas carnis]